MDDFYNKIKSSVDGISESNPSQNDWNSFLSFRDKKKNTPAKLFPWLTAFTLGLITLLLGSNIYWVTRSMDDSSSFSTATIHDTIYITKVIDNTSQELNTTIASSLAQLQVNEKLLANQERRIISLQSHFNSQNVILDNLRTKIVQKESQLSLYAYAENNMLNTTSSTSSNQNQPILAHQLTGKVFLPFLELSPLSSDLLAYKRPQILHPSSFVLIKNEKPFNLLNALSPKSFSLNINTGFQKALGKQLNNSSGRYHDLRAMTNFSNNVRGYVGMTFFKGKSELNYNHGYPNLPSIVIPEGNNLKEIKVTTSSLGLNIGLEYMIHMPSKWRPHLGLGYVHSLTNEDNFSFELDSPQGEYYVTPEDRINQAQLRQMIFSMGTDYNLSSNLDLRSAVTYYQGLTSNSASFINITGGAYYHF